MRIFLNCVLTLLFATGLWADDSEYLLRPAPGALQRVLQRYGLELKKSSIELNLYVVELDDDDDYEAGDDNDDDDDDDFDDDDLEARIRRDRDVVSFEKNEDLFAPEVKSGSTSPDGKPLEQALLGRRMVDYYGAQVWEGFTNQPAAGLIGLRQAQSRSRTGKGVVAVIDTGVDAEHPALAGALVDGYDFTLDQNGTPSDWNGIAADVKTGLTQSTTAFIDNSTVPVPINNYAYAALTQSTTAFIDTGKLPQAFGHGTMVASLVRLAAPTAKIMPLKAFQSDGSSKTFDLLRAIYYATDRGAQVISMSFNMKANSLELERAVSYAANRGVVLVASTGNDGNEIMVYPAGLPKVMGIASSNEFGQRSGFSNYGQELVTMAAPGEGVITAYPGNNYASAWGTSFSTPLVAGAVSLLIQRNDKLTAAQIEIELKRHAKPASAGGLGAGLLFVGLY